jgi:formylglycine-generating enzyme required for sulfatase activity
MKGLVKRLFVITSMVLLLAGGLVSGACPRADISGDCEVTLEDFAIMASEWLDIGEPLPVLSGMTWVSIDDPGVPGHEAFVGEMAKYETTNAQYCQFLNAALDSSDITVGVDDKVYGADGSNSGADFVGQVYYYLAGPGYTYNGATNGGAARINYNGSSFTVDSGFNNHPVTYVSWYGSTAFAGYYGYRLPTEWEWQAVADYDGSYTYGHGPGDLDPGLANCHNSTHPDGTTTVGAYGSIHDYGTCDMAGNVWEWTDSISGGYRVIRGGSWSGIVSNCTVWGSLDYYQRATYWFNGFRVCR